MAEKTYPMTLAEKEKLEKELEELKLVRRPEVVERIKIARSYGDLSENSEYEAAKDEQAFVEGQISSLETKIRYAEIVNSDSCLLYTSPSPRDATLSRMPSSA